MQISLSMDTRQLDQFTGLAPKRLAYASERALNATAKRIQQAVFAHVRQTFEIRTPFLIDRKAAATISRTDFASVRRGQPWVEIHVWTAKRFLLPYFEQGGQREPFTTGAKHAAAPVVKSPARPSWASPVPPQFKMSALKLKRMTRGPAAGRKRRRKAQGMKIWQGRDRTYEIPTVGVFQRIGHHDPHRPHNRGSRLLYSFTEPKQIRPALAFVETARSVARQFFAQEMDAQISDVLAHDLGKQLRSLPL